MILMATEATTMQRLNCGPADPRRRGEMPPEALEQLRGALLASTTAEEFANRVMIGERPRCGNTSTGDCSNDRDYGEILLARCYDCGQLWCAECGHTVQYDGPMRHLL